MGTKTGISWTDATWNPLRGCTRVSQGCVNCYAESVAARFSGPGQPYEGLAKMVNSHPRWTNTIMLVRKHLEDPLHWRAPKRVFVNSMSDCFHPDVPDSYVHEIFEVMNAAPRHQFQILTKRPERMKAYCQRFQPNPLANVWLGTSVENQETADERIPHLMQTPAAIRFLSCEPLLGPVTLWKLTKPYYEVGFSTPREVYPLDGLFAIPDHDWSVGAIDWVIVGGESGPQHRPFDVDWARSLRDTCVEMAVPFFFKQHGGMTAKSGGKLLDGREWCEMPEVAHG